MPRISSSAASLVCIAGNVWPRFEYCQFGGDLGSVASLVCIQADVEPAPEYCQLGSRHVSNWFQG